jgi:hypothetical protein
MEMQKIKEAIQLIHNPTTLNESRSLAQQYLNELNPSSKIALELIQDLQIEIQYFGMNMLLLLVDTITAETRDQIVLLVSVIKEPLITKYAQIIVEIAKRTWPFQWPSFDVLLVQWYSLYPTLTLLILKTFVEDVFVYEDPICLQRKNGLLTCFLSISLDSQSFEKVAQKDVDLVMCLTRVGNIGWLKRFELELDHPSDILMETVAVFLEWVPFEYLHPLVSKLFKIPTEKVLDCFLVLYSRNFTSIKARDELGLDPIFEQNLIQKWVDVWLRVHQIHRYPCIIEAQEHILGNEEYKIVKKVARVVSVFVHRVVCHKTAKTVPKNFETLVEFIMLMVQHSSPIVISYGMESLHELLKHEFYKSVVSVDGYVSKLIPVLIKRTEFKTRLFEEYAMIDFDGVNETHQIVFPNLFLQDVKLITSVRPLVCFRWMDRIVRSYFTGGGEYSVVQVSLCVQAIMSGIPSTFFEKTNEIVKGSDELLIGLLQTETNDCHVVAQILPMIASFSVILGLNQNLVLPVLEKLILLSHFELESENGCIRTYTGFSKGTAAVRHSAASSLLKLALKTPELVAVHLEQMAPYILNLINNKKYFVFEARLMVEVLVCVILGGVKGEKRGYLDSVMQIHVNDLEGVRDILQTKESFGQVMGFDRVYQECHGKTIPKDKVTLNKDVEKRRWFVEQFTNVGQYLRRTLEIVKKRQVNVDVWNGYIEILAPLCFKVVGYIHELWGPQQYPPEFMKLITNPTASEIGQTILMAREDIKAESECQEYILKYWKWCSKLRQECYNFLTACCSFPVFYRLPVGDLTLQILTHAQYLSLHHWRLLLHTYIIAMVTHCPPALFSHNVAPILPNISRHLSLLLSTEWQKSDPTMQEEMNDEEDVTDEIVHDLILRNVTRSFAELWHKIFIKDQEEFKYVELVQYCFSVNELVQEWTSSITLMMAIRDTVTCRTAMDVASRIITVLVKIPDSWGFLGTLLNAAIQVLMNGYHKANHHQAATLIAEIYVSLRPFSTIPMECLLQIANQEKVQVFLPK